MRAVALHADVIVFVSDVWQTTCTAVRGGDEGFVIDSPVYPEELRALPEVLEHAGFPVSGLLTTHGDWDHVLGRSAFPGAALGCAESTAERLAAELGQAQRELREFDVEHYVEGRTPLALGSLQPLPVPGRLEIGAPPTAHELELHPADGHTADGVAYWLPWARALVCGDYLSPVEIPALSPGGSPSAYRATLARLQPLVAQAEWVIPGHGAPVAGGRAEDIRRTDDAYLEQLERDPAHANLPPGRSTAPQRRLHQANLAQLTAEG
ncbi:MAG TPA: MBL fold metallo-hydrolase [Solirubrobacteraceae bacterium]|jgi:glyoxylase-like metal-dependent hydrolase (beta-lactamase superfamily II)|nr:MBL fold metallo-hydrolase [Solirubrobacteraceae bacterium]